MPKNKKLIDRVEFYFYKSCFYRDYYSTVQQKLSSFPTFAPELKHCLSRMAGEQLTISILTLLNSNNRFLYAGK
jgi:hypothetical protein